MGKYDSSKTRVKPVFDCIFENQNRNASILKRLLSLPQRKALKFDLNNFVVGELIEKHWGENEIKLNAPKGLLLWLVKNLKMPPTGMPKASLATQQKRLGLIRNEDSIIQEALKLILENPSITKKWFVLEGTTQPDVYLETENCIIVIEGKRTERKPTTSTQWMHVRHQMIRHIDAVWDLKAAKRIFGFFVVEAENINSLVLKKWLEYSELTTNDEILKKSLPHRSQQQREQIAESFLGVTTWQAICNEFDISIHLLPNEVK